MNQFLRLHQLTTRFDGALQEWGGALLNLGLRIFVGWQFFKAGLIKIRDWEGTLSLFREEYTVPLLPPELAAVMGAGGELFFPLLLITGLFSRPAALGLFAVNAMAVISYPQLWKFECPAAINDHLYWGLLLLVLLVFGAGKISLDNWIKATARS
ncbi:DoxX family protein [Undibacterium sp. Jales W-56]|uniref:DoxX family protein n=1 Tax=Undibacterium sp. Jales W-56 TaxID=2897325 RepID=UPI0021CE50B9|nr:DoxX family protein [Undibacterium sp. Jales W-56]MCU6435743.1 DoxX family protein [Undibacterium sp. Jales W-56]